MSGKRIALTIIAIAVISIVLTEISLGTVSLQALGSYLLVTLLAGVILAGCWWMLRPEKPPNWLGWLTVSAVLLRLALGIFWYTALPAWGHGSEAERAGYVMSDAHHRDTASWELAKSNKSLLAAFKEYRLADQYGGMLFASSAIYRWFGGNTHLPLMMVVLTAAFSGLSIPFAWAFTRRLWGDMAAKVASWILCFYPEAMLLGSSQMREAFLMTLAGISLYGLLVYWQNRSWSGMVLAVGALLACLPISSLFSVYLLVIITGMILILSRFQIFKHWPIWLVIGLLVCIAIGGVWLYGERIYPNGASNPFILIREWLVYAARWEERTAGISSGWMDKIFQGSPDWMNPWIILGYGTVQPFLPAALIATGNLLWRGVAIWRAIGWAFLLALLLYALVRAIKEPRQDQVPLGVSALVWMVILTSAYRGGGDQWDNPRYRVVFVVLQVALVGWVWAAQKGNPNPWFRRILVGMGWVFLWFIPWYLRRYSTIFTWPVVDLFKTLTLGLISAILYWIWDWVRCSDLNSREDPPR